MRTFHRLLIAFGLSIGLLVLALGLLQGATPQIVTSLLSPPVPAYAGPAPEDRVSGGSTAAADQAQLDSSDSQQSQTFKQNGPWQILTAFSRFLEQAMQTGEPISANDGAYHFKLPFLPLGGPTGLGFTLQYGSDFNQLVFWSGPDKTNGLPRRFWWSPLEVLEYGYDDPEYGTYATVQISRGDIIPFKQVDGEWVPTESGDFGYADNVYPQRWLLQETASFFYLMDPVGERVHIFEKISSPGGYPSLARIVRIVDRNGNQLVYTYTGADDIRPSRIEDGLGRWLDFTYQAVGGSTALVAVTDQAGRQLTFGHEAQGADNGNTWTLRSITDPLVLTTTFHYTTVQQNFVSTWYNQITEVEWPKGNQPYSQTYEKRTLDGQEIPAVVAQTDGYSNTMTLDYDPNAVRVTETRADNGSVVYEHHSLHGLPKSFTDSDGQTIEFGRDEATNRLTGTTDRFDDATDIAYHPETGKYDAYTNALGHTTSYSYTAQAQTFTNPDNGETVDFTFYDLTRITYADGTREDFGYDGFGNVLTYTNRLDDDWTYTYNDRGQPLTIANPTGGVIAYTYNADGTLDTSTDSEVGVTVYGYDDYKRLNRITHPAVAGESTGSAVHYTYDHNDQLLTVTDELNRTTTLDYDANGNVITSTNPLSEIISYAYDLMDRVEGRTDALGHASAFTYDEMSRLETATDRNGNTTTYTYDAHDRLIGVTDPLSHTWTTGYDLEGVPTSTTTPLGFITFYQTDDLGHTTVITDPLGAETHFTYDELGRLKTMTDREGRTTDYTYDDAGRLASVSLPLTRTAVYTRNTLGLLTHITDLRGKVWEFGYSTMGRRTSHTDPLSNQWTYEYDERGRLHQVTYPDTTTAIHSYDPASQITQTIHSDGPTLNYTYDDAGRLLTANHSSAGLTASISLTYDDRGDVINSQDEDGANFGATYDDGQRLKTVTYDGQATVTYTYDERDLLIRVEDDRSEAWMNFTYDDDGRLTYVQRSNGVDTTYTYDDAGRVTRIQDGALADQQYTLNDEGEPTQVARTLPLDPPPVGQVGQVGNLSYDDASQISSAGYAYDARGRQTAAPGEAYVYDGANRLISITADGQTVDLTYNGLGDLRTRTADGTTTTTCHNYALGLAPIVAESEDLTGFGNLSGLTSSYKRFYVYTPGGSLLYSIDLAGGAVRFYHFDRVGSTLFLTDGGGSVSDAYAYDPYGVLLGHDGPSDQPFIYVGRYGVRWEPVGELYHMRARHFDPTTTRFLSRDPIWPVLRDPESLNPYQYAAQNPLRYIDPLGTITAEELERHAEELERHAEECERHAEECERDAEEWEVEAEGFFAWLFGTSEHQTQLARQSRQWARESRQFARQSRQWARESRQWAREENGQETSEFRWEREEVGPIINPHYYPDPSSGREAIERKLRGLLEQQQGEQPSGFLDVDIPLEPFIPPPTPPTTGSQDTPPMGGGLLPSTRPRVPLPDDD